jgi:NAD(P)-dependent dehydrogenase (short-subunit alcohol dehydrogenase family)
VAREDDVKALVAATLARFGRLDVLVNNAGIMVRGPLLAIAAEECRRMFDVNVTGAMLCSRHALGPMIAPGGIDTDMSRDVMTPEYRARRLAEPPLHRFGSVDDVACCAIVLASDEAGYLTGQIRHPSGGWVSG